ncbi:alpha/beta hydrolase [Micromonospora sp. WMMD1128]|uniref:alpha/beta hydrolase n=1 Tax=unclassified Micromonospora TaxID=2617518 RepID=UPI00248ACF1A|nr:MULTISPECIES: alpha/beta hydrolase [unclassified Micromonospora]WBB73977.1 alpha/beta hydrolase [Micromonospora sp. WMMD1128]WFE32629.1 alpha/beta hydrolase [Micromonospora sp. WMMD975]
MANRRAVLAPGRGYDTRGPLFVYVGEALRRLGFDVHEVSWQRLDELRLDAAPGWVAEQLTPVLDAGVDLLVGKSLGSFAAPLAADRGIPAVWLTPLLHEAAVRDPLGRATAPFLLAGGTADRSWNGEVARRLSPYVVEVADADHSMMVPGPLARSADALGRVCTGVEEFVSAR